MSRRRVYATFDFAKTEEEAKQKCLEVEQNYTPYMRSKFDRPHYNRWFSLKNPETEFKYIVHYYYHV